MAFLQPRGSSLILSIPRCRAAAAQEDFLYVFRRPASIFTIVVASYRRARG
jgi:hypothetical protein